MAFEGIKNFLTGKKQLDESGKNELARKNDVVNELIGSQAFPIVHAAEVDMSKYRKVPWSGIATLGAAFSTLPQAARSVTETTVTTLKSNQPLFVELNPKNVQGFQRYFEYGTSGRVWQTNEQGKHVFAGTKYYKQVENIPMVQTTTSVLPIDPMTIMIAAALMNIDKKLDAIQEKVEEVLQFLKLDKQTLQRGNLNMLVEIFEEYKQNCENETMCSLRDAKVLDIKGTALQNILFYQEQIAQKLQKQRLIHGAKQAREFLDAVMDEFREYQLSCYLYGFSTFLDAMLQKNFESPFLEAAARKMDECAMHYHELYSKCHEQISAYQQSAIETKLIGALGSAAKAVSRGIAAVPGLNKGPVDELLMMAGESLDEHNKTTAAQYIDKFVELDDCHLQTFAENVRTVDMMYNQPKAMLMDGNNVYILEAAKNG